LRAPLGSEAQRSACRSPVLHGRRALRRGRWCALGLVLLGLSWGAGAGSALGQRAVSAESLKAAMIQKITSFVRWPKSAGLEGTRSPFLLVVLGDPELAPRLKFLYQGHPIGGHRVEVLTRQRIEDIGRPHALFVGSSFAGQLDRILQKVALEPLLTLGDTPGFAERGVAVNLFVDSGRQVGFEINRAAMRAAELSPSYQLLSFARLIPSPSGETP
jgi:hypothetical protein